LSELEQLTAYVDQNSNQDIYFGVATRDGGGGTKDNIISIPAIWCDCDYKDIDRKALWKEIQAFPFYPSLIVKSGGGTHLYWQLNEPATKDDIPKIEDANLRMAARLHGDMNACDAARILRVPGTKNHKYKPARTVEVTQMNRFYYSADDFLDLLPEVKPSKSAGRSGNGNPEGWLVEALCGVQQHDPGRNATGAKIAGYYIDRLPYRDVLTILLAYGRQCSPSLDDREVEKIVKSVSRYKVKDSTLAQSSTERKFNIKFKSAENTYGRDCATN
jgi:hypothetical protein